MTEFPTHQYLINFQNRTMHDLASITSNVEVAKSCLLRTPLERDQYGIYNITKDSVRVRQILPFGRKESARNS